MARGELVRDFRQSSGRATTIATAIFVLASGAEAAEKASEQVSPFYGSFGYSIPIEVPAFHGLEPRLALAYTSEGRNGFVGVGWSLTGISTIERANIGRGTPHFDATDIYLLDGQELVACAPGSVSPSCTSGGTHSTKIESYLKIRFDSAGNTWTVWGKDGTRTVFSPTVQVAAGTFRWGQTSVVDTKGNSVTHQWTCADGDCYPGLISYNGYSIYFFLEARPDTLSRAAYSQLTQTQYRIRSIFVWLPGISPVRAYKLSYTTSPLTGRSLLASLQQYGKDVTHDGSGLITGGTSLPAMTFSYQNDSLGRSFPSEATDPPTPPGTVEPVSWTNRINVYAAGAGNGLQKVAGAYDWDAGASSTRAISSGDGYVEFTTDAAGVTMAGLSNGDSDVSSYDIDFALFSNGSLLYAYENGATYGPLASAAVGDRLRVEVQGGHVYYKHNGVTFYTSTRTPTYPLLVDTSIEAGTIYDVMLSGALQDVANWCGVSSSHVFLTGDFNADGRTDQLCYSTDSFAVDGGRTQVRLGTATGFTAPVTWLTNYTFSKPVVGDFNADGRADIADGPDWEGNWYVIVSTGTAFSPPAFWGSSSPAYGYDQDGNVLYGACKAAGTVPGTGDFNGDGITDVSCRVVGDNKIFIGLSNGSSLSFSIFSNLDCSVYEVAGANDFDGDGKDDWYCISVTDNYMLVFPSTGSSFVSGFASLGGSFCDQAHYVLGDLNGDGRVDAACLSNGNVALSTGHSFTLSGSFGGWCPASTNFFAADVDGDGASEIVCNNSGDIQVRKWTAGAFGAVETWKPSWCATSVLAGDYNGDGKTDMLCRSQATPVALAGTGGLQADLISSIGNGLGGTIQAAYSAATSYPDTNIPKQVAASVTTDDGRGVSTMITYSYSGGRFDPKERRFLGFRYVKQSYPHAAGETQYSNMETWLRQDLASAGRPERVEHRGGAGRLRRAAAYEYTTNGGTVPLTSLLTGQWNYDYDGTGNECPTWPCPSGKRTYTAHQYDAYGNRVRTDFYGEYDVAGDENNLVWTYRPNASSYIVDRVAAQQQFAGVGTGGARLAEKLFYYDGANTWDLVPSQGYVTASLGLLDTEGRYVRRNLGYDAYGNLTSVTDEAGRLITTGYDSTSHVFPTSVTNGAGETELTAWDLVCGLPSQHTDANNQVSTMQSDALCRPTQTSLPLGSFETRSYLSLGDPNAQHVRVETPSSVPGVNLYAEEYFDGLGRTYRASKKGPAGADILQDTTYDSHGLLHSQTAPYYAGSASWATTYTYGSLDRLIRTQFPDGYSTSHTYPVWGKTTTDEHGHVVTDSFDAYGRRTLKEEHLGGLTIQTHYSYDLLGRMTGMTDHLGNAWSWTFDSLGRNTQKTDPDSGTWTFHYDDSGLLTSQTDAKGQTTSFTYDQAGRLATKTAGSVTITRSEARTGYYNVGRVTTVSSSSSPPTTQTFDYDALGRVVKQTSALEGTTYVAQKQYSTGGFLQTITYPDNDTVGTLQYDAAGRLKSIPGIVTDIQYDAVGRVVLQANANSTTTSRSYTPERGFLTAIQTTGSSGAIQNLTYTPDPAGMVTQVTSPFADESWSYGYDDLHRLTSATGSQSQTFQYDEIGRITYNSLVGTYAYDPSRPHAPSSVAGGAMTYDANGNLLTGRGRAILWNDRNLPTWINLTQLKYDGLDARVKKLTGSSASIYPMGDDYEITNGTITKYISADGLGVIAKRVGSAPNTTPYWLHTDRLGSIQAVTDVAGAIVQRRTYRPYGDKIADSTSHVESRGYIDQRQDSETGLTYLHARYYDPALGTFLNPDPIGPDGGLNEYGYGFGDPVNNADGSGLGCPWGTVPQNDQCVPVLLPDDLPTYGDGASDRRNNRDEWRNRPHDPPCNPGIKNCSYGNLPVFPVVVACPAGGGGGPNCPPPPPPTCEGPKCPRFGGVGEDLARSPGDLLANMLGSALRLYFDNAIWPRYDPNPRIFIGTCGGLVAAPVPTETTFVGQPSGPSIVIPPGSRRALIRNGDLYFHPDGSTTRIMGPSGPRAPFSYPNGRVVITNPLGQPINPATGQPGSPETTHTALCK